MIRSIHFGAAALLSALLGACASTEPPKPAPEPAPVAAPTRAPEPAKPQAEPQRAVPAPQAQPAPRARVAMPAQRSAYYDFDSYVLKPEYRPVVESNALYLKDNAAAKVRIEGNCDERGSREYNVALGQRRADAVKNALQLLGVDEQRIETVSYGKEKPRAQGHDEAAWSQNRRSDIVYQGN